MTNRRQFLRSGVAVSGALCVAPLVARDANDAQRLRLELFVLDRRFPNPSPLRLAPPRTASRSPQRRAISRASGITTSTCVGKRRR